MSILKMGANPFLSTTKDVYGHLQHLSFRDMRILRKFEHAENDLFSIGDNKSSENKPPHWHNQCQLHLQISNQKPCFFVYAGSGQAQNIESQI